MVAGAYIGPIQQIKTILLFSGKCASDLFIGRYYGMEILKIKGEKSKKQKPEVHAYGIPYGRSRNRMDCRRSLPRTMMWGRNDPPKNGGFKKGGLFFRRDMI